MGFKKIVETGGEDVLTFQSELKWFADRINENLTNIVRDVSDEVYTDVSDLSNEIWKLGEIGYTPK